MAALEYMLNPGYARVRSKGGKGVCAASLTCRSPRIVTAATMFRTV
jgi:hypothetical protein